MTLASLSRLVLPSFLAILLGACQGRAPSGVATLIYASPYSPDHPFSRADEVWMDWVQKHSGGNLRIRPLWSGTLLSSDESIIELRHGVADIGLITPIYELGGVQLIRTQTAFYTGAATIGQQVQLYQCMAERFPVFQQELRGLHVLAVQGGSLPGVLTRSRPVHSLADLRGLRIRAPSELIGVLHDLGADPVDMPMEQVYSGLAKGILDGVIAPPDTLHSLRFAEVAHYYWELQIPRGAYPARAIGERRWQTLSAADRAVLTASGSVWEAAMARQIGAAVRSGRQFGEQQRVRFSPAAPDQQASFNALYNREAERSAAQLNAYGIDGIAVFDYAREVAAGIQATGRVDCASGEAAPMLTGQSRSGGAGM
ncbi:MAG TPA: TRAP transporter substrate-binding protein DctP [Steroidobacteraceae bacterium]